MSNFAILFTIIEIIVIIPIVDYRERRGEWTLTYEGYVDHLLLLIKEKRDNMIAIANKTGYISEQTVKCSQDLDKLIYQYQEMIFDKK
ncbi:aspartyl-phosphate phosphatase Spo0E family protein [Sutcliffiella sp. FSL R7-0096]|uniref:aspartyl-phosphate phosphatase Spo0E family protein n=1 Tax=Sutcliffiella sp. FSL R7-0096 TaxID=2921670 RepID=UPI00315B209D